MPKKAVVAVAAGSNWQALKTTLHPASSSDPTSLKRRRTLTPAAPVAMPVPVSVVTAKGKGRDFEEDERDMVRGDSSSKRTVIPVASILKGGDDQAWKAGPGQFLAIDCEMVGVGPEGSESTLARVSIVNYHGTTILDLFVRPREKVTDYRTWVSGVREEDLRSAPSFVEVQKQVADLLKGRVLVGHALTNDTQVLLLSHPRQMTRDTAKYAPLQGLARTKKPGLKTLAKLCLGVDIQSGEHSSVDDARATMAVYRSQKTAWEDSLRTHTKPSLVTNSTPSLASLDLSAISLTGVKPSANPRPKTLGLAATLRHARHEAELENAVEMGEEEAEERTAKKARKEEVDGIMLNFDYVKPVAVVPVVKIAKRLPAKGKDGVEKPKKKFVPKEIRSKRGDEGKRPVAREGWWDE